MLLSRWFRSKKPTIRPQTLSEPLKESATTLKARMLEMLSEVDVDALLSNPVASMSILTLYCSSCHELIQESLTPSRNRALVGVSLYSYFKDSHLPPSLVMQRLSSLFADEPTSNYARFDIDTLITELHDLWRSAPQ